MDTCLADMGVRWICCLRDLSCTGACSLHKQGLLITVILTVGEVQIAKDISYLKYTTTTSSSHWNERTSINDHIFVAWLENEDVHMLPTHPARHSTFDIKRYDRMVNKQYMLP